MKFELFGYCLSWMGVVYSLFVIWITYKAFMNLSELLKQIVKINLVKEITILIVSIIYILVYHLS